ncbi:filamentous hemagglutinin N-terminal domain-containing protein [Polynucleobacter ibericus]|uniref:two-partner secretion domain-containing protein n=1 Tax=Polynucleobacter ibericus TaxID=1819725 RepID=UPI001BFCF902|nr:filamentous hemagglutinin N-terminal domain-containing protein [Polynucleobacter ibericus]QWE07933.1 filamentous hemagglutinin N-terminal domain-containing protein [Polynucleobacter ibericus]
MLPGVAQAAPPTPAPNALPTNGQVVAGSAAIAQTQTANSATMNVNQHSQRAVINWDSFNVGKNATVNFNQPNANSVVLNRVTGASQSMIDGAVRANGQVVFVNPNGVTFGRGAEVNAAAVVASTLNIANQEFMNGMMNFKDDGSGVGSKAGKIINKGTIQTNQTDPTSSEGGFIALLAPEVRNNGYLLAQKDGAIALASGSQITLRIQGQSLLAIKVDQGVYNGLVSNKHVIEAPGGLVVMAAGAANQLMASVIKNTGVISASSAINNGGVIELVAAKITQAGTVSSNSQVSNGGQINLVGNDITLAANSATTATGATGGGQVNIGLASTQITGGTQVNRQNNQLSTDTNAAIIKDLADQAAISKQLAKTVTIEQNATIDTSATQQGNGGPIGIWSELKTTVAGILKSVGGLLAGNGGFIETSSSGYVSLAPSASINTSATNGRVGSWLLDPVDLFINAATANIISNALSNGNVTIAVNAYTTSCSLGICILNGSGAMTIDSGAHILKAGTNYTTLTLSAAGNFLLNGSITGQNLDVVINSSIAYLGVGSSIDASKVTIQAQTIISYGRIQTSNYLFGGAGTLGNAIELLAQSIFISGALRLNVSSPLVPATIPTPVDLNSLAGNLGVNRIYYSTAANDPSILIVSEASQAASNVIKLTGIQLTAGSYTVVGLEGTSEVLANGSTGGSIYLSATDIYTRSGSFLQANGTVGAGGLIDMVADNITLAGNVTAGGVGSGNGGAISLIANTGTIDLRGGILGANSVVGTGGTIYAEVSGISTIFADNALSAGMPSSSFDLSNVLFIRERTNSAASGSLSLGYQILNASGTEVTLGTGSYANLSIAGTPSYSSNGSTITNTIGVGSYSNLKVKGLTLSGADSGQFLLVSIPVQLNVTSPLPAASATTITTATNIAPSPPPPPPPPPPPAAAFTSPLALPSSAKPETSSLLAPMVAPPPPPASTSAGGSATGGDAGSAPKNVKPQPLVVLSDGSIQLTPTAAPAPPPPATGVVSSNTAANKPVPPPAAAKPPPANRSTSGKDGANNNSNEAKRSGSVKDGVDKADSKDRSGKAAIAPSKYVSKYAKGFKEGDKPAPKDASNKVAAGTKASPPREGKYANRINAMNNNPAAFAAMRQNPFAGNISPFPPGPVLQPAPIPVVLRGGDSLVQSYDDVPSIRNSGVVNVARSRNSENYHQSLESVNLMSTLNLFIIR